MHTSTTPANRRTSTAAGVNHLPTALRGVINNSAASAQPGNNINFISTQRFLQRLLPEILQNRQNRQRRGSRRNNTPLDYNDITVQDVRNLTPTQILTTAHREYTARNNNSTRNTYPSEFSLGPRRFFNALGQNNPLRDLQHINWANANARITGIRNPISIGTGTPAQRPRNRGRRATTLPPAFRRRGLVRNLEWARHFLEYAANLSRTPYNDLTTTDIANLANDQIADYYTCLYNHGNTLTNPREQSELTRLISTGITPFLNAIFSTHDNNQQGRHIRVGFNFNRKAESHVSIGQDRFALDGRPTPSIIPGPPPNLPSPLVAYSPPPPSDTTPAQQPVPPLLPLPSSGASLDTIQSTAQQPPPPALGVPIFLPSLSGQGNDISAILIQEPSNTHRHTRQVLDPQTGQSRPPQRLQITIPDQSIIFSIPVDGIPDVNDAINDDNPAWVWNGETLSAGSEIMQPSVDTGRVHFSIQNGRYRDHSQERQDFSRVNVNINAFQSSAETNTVCIEGDYFTAMQNAVDAISRNMDEPEPYQTASMYGSSDFDSTFYSHSSYSGENRQSQEPVALLHTPRHPQETPGDPPHEDVNYATAPEAVGSVAEGLMNVLHNYAINGGDMANILNFVTTLADQQQQRALRNASSNETSLNRMETLRSANHGEDYNELAQSPSERQERS